jgi:hypothetical protein
MIDKSLYSSFRVSQAAWAPIDCAAPFSARGGDRRMLTGPKPRRVETGREPSGNCAASHWHKAVREDPPNLLFGVRFEKDFLCALPCLLGISTRDIH